MSNEQLRQRAQEIADEHCNDAYSVAMAMLEGMNKVKAEAVREVAVEVSHNSFSSRREVQIMLNYANKLENQND